MMAPRESTLDARTRHAVAVPRLARDASVQQFLAPVRRLLDDTRVNELCINLPGEVFLETAAGWSKVAVPEMNFARCMALAQALATFLNQKIGQETPLLSGDLPSGERVQIVIPPAVRGGVSITIRRPSARWFTLQDLATQGMFSRVKEPSDRLQPFQEELLDLKAAGRFEEFLRLAVRSGLTVVASGETGTGKTTLMKALVAEIAPEERVITIEDAHELRMPQRENKVHLLYSKGEQGAARVTAQDLIAACMRMRPDWILLAELRGKETFDFLNLSLSGHRGMTSVHAANCAAAFRRLGMLAVQSPEGRALPFGEIQNLLHAVVDVIVQISRVEHSASRPGRYVEEIYYDPAAQRAGALAQAACA